MININRTIEEKTSVEEMTVIGFCLFYQRLLVMVENTLAVSDREKKMNSCLTSYQRKSVRVCSWKFIRRKWIMRDSKQNESIRK